MTHATRGALFPEKHKISTSREITAEDVCFPTISDHHLLNQGFFNCNIGMYDMWSLRSTGLCLGAHLKLGQGSGKMAKFEPQICKQLLVMLVD